MSGSLVGQSSGAERYQDIRMENPHSPDLPPEVSRRITSQLDHDSLRCLARVNSKWQSAAEPLLWQTVSLRLVDCPFLVPWDDGNGDEFAESVGGKSSRKIQLLESALVTQPMRERYTEALRILRFASTASPIAAMALTEPLASRFDVFVDAKMESSVENWILQKTCQLQSALANRDGRASYIEQLHLLSTASTSASIIAILRQTSSLHFLSIGPSEINGESDEFHLHCRDNTSSLLKAFVDLTPFAFLLDLSVRITEDQWTRFWHSLHRVTPNLIRLDIGLFISAESATTLEFDSPALPHSLEELKVSITPETFPYVAGLIQINPNLHRLHLRGRQLDRTPLQQQAVKALSSCDVKRIELSFDHQATNTVWHDMLRHSGAFEKLEKLTVGFADDWVMPFSLLRAFC